MSGLPPLGSVKDCPKCGEHYTYGPPKAGEAYQSNEPGMDWHTGFGIPCDDAKQIKDHPLCCWNIHERYEDLYIWVEHISRECLICRYRWAEACFVPKQGSLI